MSHFRFLIYNAKVLHIAEKPPKDIELLFVKTAKKKPVYSAVVGYTEKSMFVEGRKASWTGVNLQIQLVSCLLVLCVADC